jgi:hypothetical protein
MPTNAVRPSLRLPRRLLVLLASIVIVAGLFAAHTSEAEAWCGTNDCTAYNKAVSAVTVVHEDPGVTSNTPVEPDTGETIEVTAYWDAKVTADQGCSCAQTATATVDVDVTWSDTTGWSAVCTGCDSVAGPIYRVSVCPVGQCGSGATIDNGWSYELIVDAALTNQTCGVNNWPGFLSHVDYETTSVDDGNLVTLSTCTEGAAVSPDSQTFTATDSTFDCVYSCAAASGPTMTITYSP